MGLIATNNVQTIYGERTASLASRNLSLSALTSFCHTDTGKRYVHLRDGAPGQMKIIVHKERLNSASLIIAFENFALGDYLTSDAAVRVVMLIFDGDNWQVLGEITGTQEWVAS